MTPPSYVSRSHTSRMLSKVGLLSCPREIRDQIVVNLVRLDPLGYDLKPLRCSCKELYNTLSPTNPDSNALYARIYEACFDFDAIRRRFGSPALRSAAVAEQLRSQYRTLAFFRRGDIMSPDVLHHFWTAFLMWTSGDGRNQIQLERAGLGPFVEKFVRARLWEGIHENNGWPIDSPINALAVWLLWFTSTYDHLAQESMRDRDEIVNVLRPFVLLAFRYPTFYAPDNHFLFPIPDDLPVFPYSLKTPHGHWPYYRRPNVVNTRLRYFGIDLELSMPLISTAAKLVTFSRLEAFPLGVPHHVPDNPEHALELGRPSGPTRLDLEELNAHKHAKLLPRPKWDGSYDDETASMKWDNDWNRLLHCWDIWRPLPFKGTVYTPGMLNGLWQGRLQIPDDGHYTDLATAANRPPQFGFNFPSTFTCPVFVRLREHHNVGSSNLCPPGTDQEDNRDDRAYNGYLPPSSHLWEPPEQGRVTITSSEGIYNYETYHREDAPTHHHKTCDNCQDVRQKCKKHARTPKEGRPPLRRRFSPSEPEHGNIEEDFRAAGLDHDTDYAYLTDREGSDDVQCSGIQDIIVTGSTDRRHGIAWTFFKAYGRVRLFDGLIVIVRIPLNPVTLAPDPDVGRTILRGYIHAGQNFVGSWRQFSKDPHALPWEGPFALSKRED